MSSDASVARADDRSVTMAGCLLALLTVLVLAVAGYWSLDRIILNRRAPDNIVFAVVLLLLSVSVGILVTGFRDIVASRPARALALTLVAPGLGHIYGREPKRALLISLGWISLIGGFRVSGLVMTFFGLLAAFSLNVLFQLWVIRDAFQIVRQQEGFAPKAYNRKSLYSLAVVLASLYLVPQILALRSFTARSVNMEPVIFEGEYFFADMARYRFARPDRGDLVIFNSPEKPEVLQIGRVIGLEGEDIKIRNKTVYIDSQPLTDPWGQHHDPISYSELSFSDQGRRRDNSAPLEVPADAIFVLGDNRDFSYDSRFFGPVPLSSIRGRPLYVYWTDKWRSVFLHAEELRIGTSLR